MSEKSETPMSLEFVDDFAPVRFILHTVRTLSDKDDLRQAIANVCDETGQYKTVGLLRWLPSKRYPMMAFLGELSDSGEDPDSAKDWRKGSIFPLGDPRARESLAGDTELSEPPWWLKVISRMLGRKL